MVIQVYAPTVDGEEPDDQFYKDLEERHPRTNTKKNVFIIGNWNAKVGSQGSPGVTGRFGFGVQNEPGQRLTEFYQENSLVIANTFPLTTQEMTLHMDITKWSNKSDYIPCS